MIPLNVRQKARVTFRYRKTRFAYLSTFPMLHYAGGHVPAKMANNCCDVRASAVGAVDQLFNECRKGEQLGVQWLLVTWLGECLSFHWCSYKCGGSHSELLDDPGDMLLLAESNDPLLPISIEDASK